MIFNFKVNCDNLFAIDLIQMPSVMKPPTWDEAPYLYKEHLLKDGQINIREMYFNEASSGTERNSPVTFSVKHMENLGKLVCSN